MAARLYPGYPAKLDAPNAPQTHVKRIACSLRASSVDVRRSVIQFARDDQALVQSSLSTIKLALQDGLLMQYSARSIEPSVVQKFVGDYAESILMSVPAADLLFQTANEAAAAWCYRMPEQLPIADEHDATDAEAQTDGVALVEQSFNQGRRSFFKDHGPFIYVHFIGTVPAMQRQGYGSQVMTAITDIADAEKKWCYLEASNQGYQLYKQHGFEVLDEQHVKPDAPVMLQMARPPQ